MKSRFGRSWGSQFLASAVIVGGVATSSNCAWGQVVEDNTVGTTVTSPIPGGFLIEGGATRGTNLFHSFSEFSVPTNGFAYFNNALNIQNILTRVTGASVSNIDGEIRANGTANVFLVNPNGIVFGAGASLNIGGSFLGSTANSVVFDNGFEFSATNPQAPPLLTVNVPLGLQYGANPGRIVNQSILAVQPGRTLGFVGGDVNLQGGILFAPGSIELGSVAGNSRVNLIPSSTGYTLGYEGVENFQDIRLTQGAFVLTDGNVGGGSIQVQGRNVTLTDGSAIATSASGAGKGGSLIVNASEGVQVIGTSTDGRLPTSLFTAAGSTATGEAGDIRITTPALLVRDGALVSASTLGAGKAGSLIINASEGVQVIGRSADGRLPSILSTTTSGTGDAGELKITTPALLVRDGAWVNARTSSAGKGGSLLIDASEQVQVAGTSADGQYNSSLSSSTFGTGAAGKLSITTGQLLISDGASISADTLGAGKGGSLLINAPQGVQLLGTSADSRFASSLSTGTLATGDAGEMRITTGQLQIRDGALLSASTLGKGKGGSVIINASEGVQVIGRSADGRNSSRLFAQANSGSTGDAGNLTITTGQLLISDGAQISVSTLGAGTGGSLIVNASDWVHLIGTSADGKSPSGLFAQTDGTGDAGDLLLSTRQLLVSNGAGVDASTFGAGTGGSLIINASDWVQVIGTSVDGRVSSALTANTQGKGEAGNLDISTRQLLVSNGAQVNAATFGAGNGGSLIVHASEKVQVIGESADGQVGSGLFASADKGSRGDAGDLTITTGQLLVRDGAQISAGSVGAGKGGDLIVRASDSVQLIGTSADGQFPSGLFASARGNSTAGNLIVETREMSVRDGAKVTVSSPSGQAGNLSITANSLSLNRGTILAETAKSNPEGGANITLQGLDLLRMDNESLISANAKDTANGGNVTINSTFIVTTPPKGSQGSDIVANAEKGNGGRVRITTQGLFGIEFRPQRTPKNDITVSSEFGLAGVFEQNTPDVDPSRGLAELPTEVVDASEQIDRRCTPAGRTAQRNSFTITGRGGLPPSPNDVLQGESVIVNWVTLDPQTDNRSSNDTSAATTAPQTPTLTEAQGWVYGSNGEVILTAEAPNVTPQSPTLTPATCSSW